MIRSKTVIATPPGSTIKKQLEARGISQIELAIRLGTTEQYVSKLITGQVRLTSKAAERLESVFGIPSKFWIKLEQIFRGKIAKVKAEKGNS